MTENPELEIPMPTTGSGFSRFLINGSVDETVDNIQEFATRWFRKTLRDHQVEWLVFFFTTTNHAHLESPRRHGKSVLLQILMLWLICQDPFLRILVAANTESLATSIIRSIQRVIENNEDDFKRLYGVEKGKPWKATEMCLSGQVIHSDPALMAKAGGAKVTGLSTDIILIDDIILADNIRTPQQYRRLKEWIYGELWNTLHPMIEKVIILGTRKGITDWYSEMLTNPDIDCRVDQAILDEGTENERPLWDKSKDFEGRGWTLEMLEKKRRLDPELFEREWMNRPSLPKGYRFDRDWIRTWSSLPRPEFLDWYMGIDPGDGLGDRASFFAITVVAVDRRTQDIYVVELYRDKLRLALQIEKAYELLQKYEPKMTICEGVFPYKYLAAEFHKKIKPMRIIDHSHEMLKGTDQKSKEGRIESRLVPLFREGKIFTKDQENDHFTRIFIERELLQFGGGGTGGTQGNSEMDLLDSLVFSIDEVENYAANAKRLAVWTA